jgi:hypothetical protein
MIPGLLYHHTHKAKRKSISHHGLKASDATSPGGIPCVFFTNIPRHSEWTDIYRIEALRFEVEEDPRLHPLEEGENWYVIYQDIPVEYLTRLPSPPEPTSDETPALG